MNARIPKKNRGRILRGLLGLLFIGFIAILVLFFIYPDGPKPKKNVLLITLDTVRADYLGCYGKDTRVSPNLDSLAMESVLFNLAIAQASVTPVSHASIFTGLNPHNHGLRVIHGRVANTLVEKFHTLAEIWRQAGGQTVAFVSAFPVTATFGLDQGFQHFDAEFPHDDLDALVSEAGMVDTGLSQRRADKTTDSALDWLARKARPDKPFFMWLHYFDPHDPFVMPPVVLRKAFKPDSKRQDVNLRAIYSSEVLYMDSQIGRVITDFKKRGFWENTIVVVVSDHGEGLNDHDWWFHGILYQEQIQVPLLIRIPETPKGTINPSLVRTIDLMPTILEAAEISPELHPVMDGFSLVDMIRNGRTDSALTAYSDSVNILTYGRGDIMGNPDRKDDKLYSLTTDQYKLIYHQLKTSEIEFYDLLTDPGETLNLAGSNPPEMQAMLKELIEMDAFSMIMPGMTESDEETNKKLESLGYIQ